MGETGETAAERFARNLRLAYHFAARYGQQWRIVEPEDVVQLCLLGLWKACCAYRPQTGWQFATLAATCMRNEVLMAVRRQRRHREGAYRLYEAARRGQLSPSPAYAHPEGAALLHETLRGLHLRPEVRTVLEEGCSHTEAGRRHGISQSLVSRRVRQARLQAESALSAPAWDARLGWGVEGASEAGDDAWG